MTDSPDAAFRGAVIHAIAKAALLKRDIRRHAANRADIDKRWRALDSQIGTLIATARAIDAQLADAIKTAWRHETQQL